MLKLSPYLCMFFLCQTTFGSTNRCYFDNFQVQTGFIDNLLVNKGNKTIEHFHRSQKLPNSHITLPSTFKSLDSFILESEIIWAAIRQSPELFFGLKHLPTTLDFRVLREIEAEGKIEITYQLYFERTLVEVRLSSS